MDFIERIFGISPDGGSGVTEALYLLVFSAFALVIIFRQRLARLLSCAISAQTRTKPLRS